jgi:carbamoyltransferase
VHIRAMRDIVHTTDDLFALDLDYFTHEREGVDMIWDEGAPQIAPIFSEKLVETLGPPREPDAELTQHHRDVAAAVQRRLEEVCLHLVQRLHQRTALPDLCLSGGVALNAVANGRIALESDFERVHVPPSPGDSGTAIGAAYYVWHQVLGQPRGFVMRHAFTGPAYESIEGERLDDEELCRTIAERIAAGDVVGWFQGRMEFGPRALGHRSILADPRNAAMREILNARIKHREPFRPFALSILADETDAWLEHAAPSPFMGLVYRTRSEIRDTIPAVGHVDHTARVQTVERDVEPLYYRLIEEFGRQTGVPLVLNTSFNENEPIVMTPEDALETFRNTHMDVLVLGNYVVRS